MYNLYERSGNENDNESEWDAELTFQDNIFTNKELKDGDDIDELLAQALQMILLGHGDTKELMIIHDNNPRSGKVTGLIVSELSKEVDIPKITVYHKQSELIM